MADIKRLLWKWPGSSTYVGYALMPVIGSGC